MLESRSLSTEAAIIHLRSLSSLYTKTALPLLLALSPQPLALRSEAANVNVIYVYLLQLRTVAFPPPTPFTTLPS